MRKIMFFLTLAAVLAFTVAPAKAVTYPFESITNTNAANVLIGETYLKMAVTPYSTDKVDFKFYWSAVLGSQTNLHVSDFYFYDGKYVYGYQQNSLTNPEIIPGSGDQVYLSPFASPQLPGGTNVGLGNSSQFYSVDPNTPNPVTNGLQMDEEVTFRFTLKPSYKADDVIAAINRWISLPITDKKLVTWSEPPELFTVGLHVQGFANGGSESFVPVPLPGAVLLLGAGLARLVAYARRRED